MTQKQNKALNGIMWQRIPKEVYAGNETLEFGLYNAVAHFNIGSATATELFQALGILHIIK